MKKNIILFLLFSKILTYSQVVVKAENTLQKFKFEKNESIAEKSLIPFEGKLILLQSSAIILKKVEINEEISEKLNEPSIGKLILLPSSEIILNKVEINKEVTEKLNKPSTEKLILLPFQK